MQQPCKYRVKNLSPYQKYAVQAYKNYISTVLTRVNTVNGRTYSEDPTVFSWELANEPASTADQTGETVGPGHCAMHIMYI